MIRKLRVAPLKTLAAGAGIVAVIGCGSEEASTKQATPTPAKAAAATVPDELVGTWVTRLRPSTTSYLEPGEYTMKMHADGGVDVYTPKGDTAEDCVAQAGCAQLTVEASGGALTIIETPDCTDPAQYSYKLTGDRLTTKQREQDDCGAAADRPRLYNGVTWRRQSS